MAKTERQRTQDAIRKHIEKGNTEAASRLQEYLSTLPPDAPGDVLRTAKPKTTEASAPLRKKVAPAPAEEAAPPGFEEDTRPIGPKEVDMKLGTDLNEVGEKMAAVAPLAQNALTFARAMQEARAEAARKTEERKGGVQRLLHWPNKLEAEPDIKGAGGWQAVGDAAAGLTGGIGGAIGGVLSKSPGGAAAGAAAGGMLGHGVKKLTRSWPDPGPTGRAVQMATEGAAINMAKLLQGARASDVDLKAAREAYGLDVGVVDFEERIVQGSRRMMEDARRELTRLKATAPEAYEHFRSQGLWGLEELDEALLSTGE